MNTFETISHAVRDGVATLTLNRPQAKNALNPAMADELAAAVKQAAEDPAVRALVLTGAGGAFCAGGDVRAMDGAGPRSAATIRAGMARYHRVVTAMASLEKPVVAAVDGVAYGAGFSIALLADIILVSDRARLSMVFQRIGLIPDMGALYTLPRCVGLQRARELILSAREVGATEAVSLGIALEMLPGEALLPRAQELATSFCGASGAALAITKRALGASLQSDLATMLELEANGQAIAAGDDYLKEAARRFVAKEGPQFRWPARNP